MTGVAQAPPVTFTVSHYDTGEYPDSVATGDFNGDGKLDLAVANRYSHTVSVLLGNGDGTFETKVDYDSGPYPYSVTAGDFDGDGKLDLAVSNGFLSGVNVLLGNGDGTFAAKVAYDVGPYTGFVTTADFNGDGRLDLVTTSWNEAGTTVIVLMNTTAVSTPDVTPPAIAGLPTNLLLEATGPAGAVATWTAPTATDDTDGSVSVTCTPESGSTFPLDMTTLVTCTATDAAGNTATASFTVTVQDKTPPTITACATNKTVRANGSGQAAIPNLTGEVQATDNVTPAASLVVTQLPAAGTLVGVGTHTVTLTVTDAADNASTCTATVTVLAVGLPGRMHGEGRIDVGAQHHQFEFNVRERVIGAERGHLRYEVRTSQRGRDREDRFVATAITSIVFTDDPGLRPGGRATVDTVMFTGVGTWNRAPGYTFEARATDAGEPGARRDSFEITVRDPGGAVVGGVSGVLSHGNIQSNRVRR